MITNITLKRFKCFNILDIHLRPLTLIAGVNGAGKSSIIQALLLLRQSSLDPQSDWSEKVLINGALTELDDVEQLYYSNASNDDDKTVDITLVEENDDELTFKIKTSQDGDYAPVEVEGDIRKAKNEWQLFDKNNFAYLYADRFQPRRKYSYIDAPATNSRLGDKHGCNTAFTLARAINSNQKVSIASLCFEGKSDLVSENVSLWLSYIMGNGVSVTSREKDKEAFLEYSLSNENGEEYQLSPLNMPFGDSYILPIVVGILTAKQDSVFIVENPESHLHPSAQTRIGEFLAIAAQAGVQVIIETHSDHLMNGIRVACMNRQIDSANVEMLFVYRLKNSTKHARIRIGLNEDGSIENWEPGFFDEWEKNLRKLTENQ